MHAHLDMDAVNRRGEFGAAMLEGKGLTKLVMLGKQ